MLTPAQRSEILLTNIAEKDCGVIALQALTGWRRRTAERRLAKAGYTELMGTPRGALETALQAAGYSCDHRRVDPNVPKDTAATFTLTHEYGLWLVYVENHVMAVVEGDLHNSRGYWHAPVEAYTAVTR